MQIETLYARIDIVPKNLNLYSEIVGVNLGNLTILMALFKLFCNTINDFSKFSLLVTQI